MDEMNFCSPTRQTLESAKKIRELLRGEGPMSKVHEVVNSVSNLYKIGSISKNLFYKFKSFYRNEMLNAQISLLREAGVSYVSHDYMDGKTSFVLCGKLETYSNGPVSGFFLEETLHHRKNKFALRNAVQEFFNNGEGD